MMSKATINQMRGDQMYWRAQHELNEDRKIELFQEAIAFYEKGLEDINTGEQLACLINLGMCNYYIGKYVRDDYEASREYLESSVQYFDRVVKMLEYPELVFHARVHRALALLLLERYEQSYKDFAIAITESEARRRKTYRNSDAAGDGFQSVWASTYYGAVEALLRMEEGDATRAFEILGQIKSRYFQEQLANNAPPETVPKRLRDQDLKIRTRLAESNVSKEDREQLRLSQETLYSQIADYAPAFTRLRRGQPIKIKDVISMLVEN